MKKIILKINMFLMISLMTFSAFAQDTLGSQAGKIGDEVASFGDLFMIIIGVTGVVFMLLGGVGLKKYADDSRSNPLMKPLIFFVAGGIMAGVSAFQALFSVSLTGEVDKNTGTGKFKAPNADGATKNTPENPTPQGG